KSIAVIGASNTKGSVGYMLLHNLIGVGYEGVVYPVNTKRSSVQGIHAYSSISQIPTRVDADFDCVDLMTKTIRICCLIKTTRESNR
ncbi:MAG: CoA-binding protein, partial [Methanosarcinales archaeon]|nr:CoA-binding protein [Methanosarcinales archaeon]